MCVGQDAKTRHTLLETEDTQCNLLLVQVPGQKGYISSPWTFYNTAHRHHWSVIDTVIIRRTLCHVCTIQLNLGRHKMQCCVILLACLLVQFYVLCHRAECELRFRLAPGVEVGWERVNDGGYHNSMVQMIYFLYE